jgi:ABC-type transporter Mla maintaining outer membrane lipid asymmetry ATPase subunit MlaF
MLEIKDLKASTDDKEILKGLNLTINKGEIHAIMQLMKGKYFLKRKTLLTYPLMRGLN